MLKCYVLTTVLYGVANWVIGNVMRKRIDAAEIWSGDEFRRYPVPEERVMRKG